MWLIMVNEWLATRTQVAQPTFINVKEQLITFATFLTLEIALKRLKTYEIGYMQAYPTNAMNFRLLSITHIPKLTKQLLSNLQVQYIEDLPNYGSLIDTHKTMEPISQNRATRNQVAGILLIREIEKHNVAIEDLCRIICEAEGVDPDKESVGNDGVIPRDQKYKMWQVRERQAKAILMAGYTKLNKPGEIT
jgi:hypothetical protein